MERRLKGMSGPAAGMELVLPAKGRFIFGRSLTANFTLQDGLVSRQHCALELSPAQVRLYDLGSSNGTFVNGAAIDNQELQDGDQFQVGNSLLLYRELPEGQQLADPEPATADIPPTDGYQAVARRTIQALPSQQLGALSPSDRAMQSLSRALSEAEETVQAGEHNIRDFMALIRFCSRCQRTLSCHTLKSRRVRFLGDEVLCPDCSSDIEIGELNIPGYQILKKIGVGAAGTVYLAKPDLMDRQVAIKVLRQDEAVDERVRKRFLREAKSLASLNHPNIVRIFDGSAEGRCCYIVTEYVPGVTVAEMLSKWGVIPVPEALDIITQVAKALEFAHQKNFIHRDLKPGNIVVHDSGRAKLMDFGLAKNVLGGASRITHTGERLGTPQYMAPEQLRSADKATFKSDIYAVGSTLFHMVAGVPAFDTADLDEFLKGILQAGAPPVLSKAKQVIPPDLADLIDECLALEPKDRPTSMTMVRKALEGLRKG